MTPHAKNLNYAFNLYDLVNQTVLNINPAGVSAPQIAYQLFVWWWTPKGFDGKQIKQQLSLRAQASRSQSGSVFLSVSGEDDRPAIHQPGSFSH